jgi:hypothetical protein
MGMYGGGGGNPEIPETPEEKEAAKIALERWQHYQDFGMPNENLLMKKVNHIGTGEAHQVEGQAASAIESGFAPQQERANLGLNRAGVNPASGRAAMANANLADQQGRALGLATTNAGNQVENLHYRGLEHVVNMGLGIKDNAQLGLGHVASMAADNAKRSAFDSQYASAARKSALGTAAGAFTAYGLPYFEKGGGPGPDLSPGNVKKAQVGGLGDWNYRDPSIA